jgi:flagellar assembly protein FliH
LSHAGGKAGSGGSLRAAASGIQASGAQAPSVQAFVYPAGSNSSSGASQRSTTPYSSALFQPGANDNAQDEQHRETSEAARIEFDRRLAEETRRSFEAGRGQGRVEGRQAECEVQAVAVVAAERERLRQAVNQVDGFARERERYFAEVEREVVALALAIAARILRREAQMDPLLLTGAVRVALGQLSASTTAQLVVPPAELDLWKDAIAHAPNLALKPAVVPGEGMRLGECMIKTDLGSADLGLRSQLGEIERGFFDRVGAPKSASDRAEVRSREVVA